MINFNYLIFSSYSIHLQIRSTWLPLEGTCAVTDVETSQPSLIALFATDFLLLLIMLAGLLRLRRSGGDSFELGRLLWKQVEWRFSLAVMSSTC
jgi:hypothetical protein